MHFGHAGKHAVVKTGIIFFLLAIAVVVIHYWPDFDEDALALYVKNQGAFGVAVYIILAAAGSAVGVPRQGLSFMAGYAFGVPLGTVFVTLATTLGCALGFSFSRCFGRGRIPSRFTNRMKKLDAFLSASPFVMALCIRCMPFGNNAITNVLAGMTSIPALGFIGGSLVGYIPQNFIFALLGSGMRVDPFWRILIAAILFSLALGFGLLIFFRHRSAFAGEDKKN